MKFNYEVTMTVKTFFEGDTDRKQSNASSSQMFMEVSKGIKKSGWEMDGQVTSSGIKPASIVLCHGLVANIMLAEKIGGMSREEHLKYIYTLIEKSLNDAKGVGRGFWDDPNNLDEKNKL
jgi:hypothetical protein